VPSVKKPHRSRTQTFIRAWREYRDLSQEQMASRLDISRTNYSRIENGKVPYNQDFLEMAAVALNCTVSDLLERNPYIEDQIAELNRLMTRASSKDQSPILAVIKTLLENNG
jgi:transcriptional regulator with XRE-family HTH domain